jgi:hypothetical protein
MSAPTMEQRFCAALEARGEALVRTGKYRVYTRTKGMPLSARPSFYYVGASGALRVGCAAVGSIPAGRKFKEILLAEGSEELGRRKAEGKKGVGKGAPGKEQFDGGGLSPTDPEQIY